MPPNPDTRTLPFRAPPLPGEALESWLGMIARRMGATWQELIDAVLPGTAALEAHNLSHHIAEQEAHSIAAATGTNPRQITALTLAGQSHAHLSIDPHRRHVVTPWGAITRHRFCPRCLKDNGGRWMLNWRLPWVFACPRHLCLLADSCPRCGRRQTLLNGWWSANSVPEPTLCRELSDRNGDATRCRSRLEVAPTLRIPKATGLLNRQQQILDLLTHTDTSIGIYHGQQAISSSQLLIDIRALAMRLLDAAPAQRLLEHLGFALESPAARNWIGHLGRDGDTGELPVDQWFGTSADALVIAIGIASALDVIDSESLNTAGAKLANFPCRKSQRIAPVKVRQGLSPSPQLCAAELLSRAERFTAFDDLRYCRYSSLPRRPEAPGRAFNTLLTAIPTQLWSNYALMMLPGQPRLWRPGRQVLSVMLASVGSAEAEPNIERVLKISRDPSSTDHIARQLRGKEVWPKMVEGLILLNHHLTEHPPPINYQRRREIDYSGLLPAEEWSELRPLADAGRVGNQIEGAARAWLYERISGMHWRSAVFARTVPENRGPHDRFLIILSDELRAQLDLRAAQFLQARGIVGEPMTWEPPDELIAHLDLPGPELSRTPTRTLERIRQGRLTIDAAAAELQVDRTAMAYWLQNQPARLRTPSRASHIRDAKSVLNRDTLQRLYVEERRSFVEIARHFGIASPRTVSELAVHYGIPRRRSTPINIDPEWIKHQHLTCRRTFGELAEELGVSSWSVRNIARSNGIPIKKHSRRKPNQYILEIAASMPSTRVLLPAMTNDHGWIRLTRFAAATKYEHLSHAANALGIRPDVLRRQVARLEADLGQLLLHRYPCRDEHMYPSDFGGKVARAVQLVERRLQATNTI